jgi:hypothetical protein
MADCTFSRKVRPEPRHDGSRPRVPLISGKASSRRLGEQGRPLLRRTALRRWPPVRRSPAPKRRRIACGASTSYHFASFSRRVRSTSIVDACATVKGFPRTQPGSGNLCGPRSNTLTEPGRPRAVHEVMGSVSKNPSARAFVHRFRARCRFEKVARPRSPIKPGLSEGYDDA